jgi:hypothetical protein
MLPPRIERGSLSAGVVSPKVDAGNQAAGKTSGSV